MAILYWRTPSLACHRVWTCPRLLLIVMMWRSLLVAQSDSGDQFIPASNNSCACPNRILTYTCTVVGGGSTVWTGSGFSCSGNEIVLLHTEYADRMAVGMCNNGAIIGQGLSVNGNRYTSELRVNASSGLNNTAVRCLNAGLATVGEASINVISRAHAADQIDTRLQLPTIVSSMTGIQLNFTWTVVNLDCTSIDSYQITASGCGNCPVATETTSAICSGLQMPAVCRFSVRSVVCGEIGMPSTLSIRVPDQQNVTIVPIYSATDETLIRLQISITDIRDSVDLSDGIARNYSISYNSEKTATIDRDHSCVTNTCVYVTDVPSDVCTSSDDVDITLLAFNMFGMGPPTNTISYGCLNRLVHVEYDETSAYIICTFLNESDTSVKSCTVTYGQCQDGVQPMQESRTANASIIRVPVNRGGVQCYNVTAGNDVFSVVVEGIIAENSPGAQFNTATIVTLSTLATLAALLTVIVLIIILAAANSRRLYKKKDSVCSKPSFGQEMAKVTHNRTDDKVGDNHYQLSDQTELKTGILPHLLGRKANDCDTGDGGSEGYVVVPEDGLGGSEREGDNRSEHDGENSRGAGDGGGDATDNDGNNCGVPLPDGGIADVHKEIPLKPPSPKRSAVVSVVRRVIDYVGGGHGTDSSADRKSDIDGDRADHNNKSGAEESGAEESGAHSDGGYDDVICV